MAIFIIPALIDFASIPYNETSRDFRKFTSSSRHIIGNSMRLGGIDEIRLDEQWKASLSKLDMEYFERYAGSRNRELGY